MRRQDSAVLAFKMIGAVIAAYGFIELSGISGIFAPNAAAAELPAWAVLLGLVPMWVMIGVGGAFWVGAPWLGARVFADAPPPDFAEPLDVNSILQLALPLLGTYFLLDAIPQLFQAAGLYLYSRRMGALALGYDPQHQAAVFGANAQAALGAAVARAVLGCAIFANRARLAAHLKPTRVVNPFAEDEPVSPQAP
jgi:hypothetical protein